MDLLIGTYTRNTAATGVYVYRREIAEFKLLNKNADIDNPSFLIRHPMRDIIYLANETDDLLGSHSGGVSAYRYLPTGKLELINQQPSMGADPCHLALNPENSFLLASNYTGGSFATFPLGDDGSLGEPASVIQHQGHSVITSRQASPHVHSALFTGTGEVHLIDLGTDQIATYPVAGDGQVVVNGRKTTHLNPGAGPRLMTRVGNNYYVINELDNTVTSFRRVGDGHLETIVSYSSLPDDFEGASSAAHIAASSDGRFLYVSNRGHDSIVVLALSGEGGMRPVQFLATGGEHPRHFTLTPDEQHLLVANMYSNSIRVFSRDSSTGELTDTGTTLSVPSPSCLLCLDTDA